MSEPDHSNNKQNSPISVSSALCTVSYLMALFEYYLSARARLLKQDTKFLEPYVLPHIRWPLVSSIALRAKAKLQKESICYMPGVTRKEFRTPNFGIWKVSKRHF